ncbi:MAG: N-acetyltransferase family protein [Candidatus Methylacidiphilales bacterium]|nr:GNAT family N-acetyltransferase [Candidatus Methylacidiphilales bacterium]
MIANATATATEAYHFRKATETDLPALIPLMRDTVAAMIAGGNDQWDDTYPSAQVMSKDIAAQTLEVLVETATNRIVGCVTVDRFITPLWAGMAWTFPEDQVTAVHRLMIHPSQQGKGLAKKMMQHVETVAREQHHSTCIRLDTYVKNTAAHALYPRLGYRYTGTADMRKGKYSCFEKPLN